MADIKSAVRAGRDAVRPAAGFVDLALAAVRRDSGDLLPGNLAEDYRAVRHPHRPFRKAEIARQDLDVGHCRPSPAYELTWRMIAAQRSSRGNVASAPSAGSIATQRTTPISR